MLEGLFGNRSLERILFYLYAYQRGYPRGMSRDLGVSLRPVVVQLNKLEGAGIVVSRLEGKTRLYEFNPRYPLLDPLTRLIEKAMAFLPQKERRLRYEKRTRPRRAGKPGMIQGR